MDAKNKEPWREIEPFLGCDVLKQEVVLLSQVKAMCDALAGDYTADLARLTAELERKQRECERMRFALCKVVPLDNYDGRRRIAEAALNLTAALSAGEKT